MISRANDLVNKFKNLHPPLTEAEFDYIVNKLKEIFYSYKLDDSTRVRVDELFNNDLVTYKEQYLRNIDIPNTEERAHDSIMNLINELEKLKENYL